MEIPADVIEMTVLNNGICMGVTCDNIFLVWNETHTGTMRVCDAVSAVNANASSFLFDGDGDIVSDMSMIRGDIRICRAGMMYDLLQPRASVSDDGFFCIMEMRAVRLNGDHCATLIWGHLSVPCEPRH